MMKRHLRLDALMAVALLIATLTTALPTAASAKQCGKASWYALRGKTASGRRFQPSAMLAAHRSLPFGTRVRVTSRHTGRSVVVRIVDRGPFVRGRVIDVSRAAARRLGFLNRGVARVCIAVLGRRQ